MGTASSRVDYVGDGKIEAQAEGLLAAYAERFPAKAPRPTPIDGIVESLLDLSVDYADLRAICGAGVRGVLCVGSRTIWIDESIEPETYPDQDAIYRFTAAHEVGHWMLHRSLLPASEGPPGSGGPSAEAVRWSGTHQRQYDRVEVQANIFAAALLMPKAPLLAYWREMTGSDQPYDACDEFQSLGGGLGGDGNFEPVVELAQRMAKPFSVSGFAMQIRLKRMRLLRLSRDRDPAANPASSMPATSGKG